MFNFQTPILFLIFNRPETTRRVFEEIRKLRPNKLFIAGDGPRADHPEDREKVLHTREIVANIDWPCEVKTLFQEENLGCRYAPPTAVTWFFEQVEAGIILEDDCLPDPSFFPFCAELLERYANDTRVMQISGDCFQDNNSKFMDVNSYYFSIFPHLWGWASWRRAWKQYDLAMVGWPEVRSQETLRSVLTDPAVYSYWEYLWNQYYDGSKNSWDGPWAYACMMHNGLSINPTVNLISNIGFGSEATHTKDAESILSKIPVSSMLFPLTHPKVIEPNTIADAFAFRNHFGINASLHQRILGPFKKRFPKTYRQIKSLLKTK
jgi:hypothetical protein